MVWGIGRVQFEPLGRSKPRERERSLQEIKELRNDSNMNDSKMNDIIVITILYQ